MKRIFLLLAILTLTLGIFLPIAKVKAVSATDWQAGNIIDDGIFTNANAMSVQDIQNFLIGLVPTCDTWGTGISEYNSSLTRANYAASQGWPGPPYVCLRDYYEVPKTDPGATVPDNSFNHYDAAAKTLSTVPGGISAAQIIYNAAHNYNISPYVLLVKLRTESSGPLTNDNWPLYNQYKYAMGAHCPDSGPGGSANCDANYAGFSLQVSEAASLLRWYIDSMTQPWWTYKKPYQTNTVLWNVAPTGCGGSDVYIQSKATAALYTYTPYQPNQAALSNLYGTGDGCSSYGNRNFWRIWSDWFGSPLVPKSTLYIPDGTYNIMNPASSRDLDVTMGGTTDGSRVWLYDNNGSDAQKWQVTRDDNGYYSFKNIGSGKYLDVVNGSTSMGSGVQIWSGNNSCAQKWTAVSLDGGFSLFNVCSGHVLDIMNGSKSNGAQLQMWGSNQSGAQKWNLVSLNTAPLQNGFYRLNTPSSLSLDVVGNSTAAGANTQISNSIESGSQYWQVLLQSDGYYKLRNPISGKLLDVTGASSTSGTAMQIWTDNGSCAQRWSITQNADATYELRSACSGKALDVANGAVSTAGAKVQIWDSNKSSAQKWIFGSISGVLIPNGVYSLLTTTGNAVDITSGKTYDGAKTQLWPANGTAAQAWYVSKLPDNSYSLRNPISGKLLDVTGASSTSGTAMQIWTDNGSCAQRWSITQNADATYELRSACSGKALDVANGAVSTAGAKVQIWDANNSSAQKWVFGAPQ